MIALVISDSHGANEAMAALIKNMLQHEKPDTLIFCGDGYMDAYTHRKAFSRWLGVRGNCDISVPTGAVAERCEKLGGVFVLITHGNQYRVKQSLLSLNLRALEIGAQVACFGHTHHPFCELQRSVLMLNPGALCLGEYALLEIGETGIAQAMLKKM